MARSQRQATAAAEGKAEAAAEAKAEAKAEGAESSQTPPRVVGVYVQQAAHMVGTSPASIRTWERYGLVSPQRTKSGYRVYSVDDVERLRQIQRLLNDGVNPPGIRRLLADQSSEVQSHSRAANESGRSRDVGEVIREKRRRSGLTLREVSKITGLSPSYISAIERSLAHPSLSILSRLAAVFDTNVLALMGDSYGAHEDPVVRANERRVLESDDGIVIEDMSTLGNDLEPLIITIIPGAGTNGPLSHEGEEFLFVLSGQLSIRLDGATDYLLSPGDSMAYSSLRSHQFGNEADEPVSVVWVNTPRTF